MMMQTYQPVLTRSGRLWVSQDIRGPKFTTTPTGHGTNYRMVPPSAVGHLYPNHWHRVGASWWRDDHTSVLVWVTGMGDTPYLIYWDMASADWRHRNFRVFSASVPQSFQIHVDVRPGRVPLSELLRPWIESFRAEHTEHPRKPLSSQRMLQGLRADPGRKTLYGWVDHPAWNLYGNEWVDRLNDRLRTSQGLIPWGWAYLGEPWYPYDSEDLPDHLAAAVSRVPHGALVRPGAFYSRDRSGRITFAAPYQHSPLAADYQFQRVRGRTHVYLDDFGIGHGDGSLRSAQDDLRLLRHWAELGYLPTRLYVEFPSDQSLLYADGYLRLSAGADYWIGAEQFAALRRLHPSASFIVARDYAKDVVLATQELVQWCEAHGCTPLVEDWVA